MRKGWVNHSTLQQMLAVVIPNISKMNLEIGRLYFFFYDR